MTQNDTRSPFALLLIDVINHFDFPEGEKLRRQAMRILPSLVQLKGTAVKNGIPVVYVNDNFGLWRSDFRRLVEHCLRDDCRGREFVRPLAPTADDHVILKPKHSAFYQTPLDLLLEHLGTRSLVIAGIASDSCVLCTAHDGNMRGYELAIPRDCSASYTPTRHRRAMEHLNNLDRVSIAPLAEWELTARRKARRSRKG